MNIKKNINDSKSIIKDIERCFPKKNFTVNISDSPDIILTCKECNNNSYIEHTIFAENEAIMMHYKNVLHKTLNKNGEVNKKHKEYLRYLDKPTIKCSFISDQAITAEKAFLIKRSNFSELFEKLNKTIEDKNHKYLQYKHNKRSIFCQAACMACREAGAYRCAT